VNLSGEAQKGGVLPSGLGELVQVCAKLPHLVPLGLMVVPAESPDPQTARPIFAALRGLARDLGQAFGPRFGALSMGMSHDFEVAIEEGATHVRVGTALFGPREG